MQKVLALDYGKKRIGLASGDTETKISFPQSIIENKGGDFVISEIIKFCEEWSVGLIVVGLPLNMDNDEEDNEMMKEVRFFVKKLKDSIEVNVELFDERLSSFEAEEIMRADGKNTKDQKEHKDAFAAQIILQRYFDSL